jgi:tetratricopeptide (TPR) repeat protein
MLGTRFRMALFAAAVIPWTAGAIAADPNPSASKQKQVEFDPVTTAVQRSPLILLRIAAISLDDVENQGEALAGLVGAFLKRNRLKDANVDFSVITDPLWRARALVHFADHHVSNGVFLRARENLRDAAKLIDAEVAERDNAGVLRLIARRQAEFGDFDGALSTARRIVDPETMIEHMLRIAERQGAAEDSNVVRQSRKTADTVYRELKAQPIEDEAKFQLLLKTAQVMTTAGHMQSALGVLDDTHRKLRARPSEHVLKQLTTVAVTYIAAGGKAQAMKIVRTLKQDERRARALASIGAEIALRGSREGAAPLFLLALQDIEGITDPKTRGEALIHVIRHQAKAGRLADAFNAAGKIRDARLQHRALFAMGEALLEMGKVKEALKLIDYLPDIGMRARLYAAGAKHKLQTGDRKGAEMLLAKSLDPTGAKSTPEMLAQALPELYETQVALGATPSAQKVYSRIRKLLGQIPDGPEKIYVMTRLARAQAEGGQKDAMERSLGFAWRIAWLNKDQVIFPELLEHISEAQLAVGELLTAFDTAARIPDETVSNPGERFDFGSNRKQPKYRALQSVAVAAAERGDGKLALRAARKITHPGARAGAYSAVALALPLQPQQAKAPPKASGWKEFEKAGNPESVRKISP